MRRGIVLLTVACSACTAREPVYQGKSLPDWIEGLQAPDPRLRSEAARALGDMGAAASAGVPSLTKALRDQQPSVRVAAAEALGRIGAESRSAIPALKGAQARDENDSVRQAAATALLTIQASELQGHGTLFYIGIVAMLATVLGSGFWARRQFHRVRIKLLVTKLKGQAAAIRLQAAHRLGLLGQAALPAIPALIDALGDTDAAVRNEADNALAKIGVETKRDLAHLILHLQHGSPFVRARAAVLLGQFGRRGQPGVTALIEGTKDKEPLVRIHAIEALGNIGAQAAVPCLMVAREDSDHAIHRAAILALEKIGA